MRPHSTEKIFPLSLHLEGLKDNHVDNRVRGLAEQPICNWSWIPCKAMSPMRSQCWKIRQMQVYNSCQLWTTQRSGRCTRRVPSSTVGSCPRGHVCPFPGPLIKHRWREIFRGRMWIIKVKGGFLLLSVSVLSLWQPPQATWHFNKMLNCTINTSVAGRATLFVLSSTPFKWGTLLCSGWSGTGQGLGTAFGNLVGLSCIILSSFAAWKCII